MAKEPGGSLRVDRRSAEGSLDAAEPPWRARRRRRSSGGHEDRVEEVAVDWRAAAAGIAIAVAADRAGVRRSPMPRARSGRWSRTENFQGAPAWSPDGKTLAYVAPVDGILQVFTRSEGSLPYQVTRTRFDASNPFWSPDGARIYFHSLAQAVGEPVVDQRRRRPGRTRSAERDPRRRSRLTGQTLAFFRERETPIRRGSDSARPSGSRRRTARTSVATPRNRWPRARMWTARSASRPTAPSCSPGCGAGPIRRRATCPQPEFWMLPLPTGKPYQVLPSLARASPVAASFDWFPTGDASSCRCGTR